ncbi:rRNA accumulation-related protein [Diatrype stigma]|uniref:rRNA accumulation-related protein n=1 Tax=Diatrype stigma TaxID=117547 RepID=A0AAN9YTZ2_9PEZI
MASSSPHVEPSPETRQSNFEQGVALALHLWPALTLAVQNNWGGPSSADKRDWFAGAIVEMFPSFPDLAAAKKMASKTTAPPAAAAAAASSEEEPEIEDVEATLLQVMVDEFEVNVDDDSGFESAETIMRIRAQCAKGDFREVDDLRRRWEAGRGKKVAAVQAPDVDQDTDDDGGSDWESDDDDGNGDVDMDEAPALVPAPKEKPPPPEVDEDGFTKVTRKKR